MMLMRASIQKVREELGRGCVCVTTGCGELRPRGLMGVVGRKRLISVVWECFFFSFIRSVQYCQKFFRYFHGF